MDGNIKTRSLKVPSSLAGYLLNLANCTLCILAKTSSPRSLVFMTSEGWSIQRVERIALVQAEDTERLKVFDGVCSAMEHWDESSEMLFETIAEAVENMT